MRDVAAVRPHVAVSVREGVHPVAVALPAVVVADIVALVGALLHAAAVAQASLPLPLVVVAVVVPADAKARAHALGVLAVVGASSGKSLHADALVQRSCPLPLVPAVVGKHIDAVALHGIVQELSRIHVAVGEGVHAFAGLVAPQVRALVVVAVGQGAHLVCHVPEVTRAQNAACELPIHLLVAEVDNDLALLDTALRLGRLGAGARLGGESRRPHWSNALDGLGHIRQLAGVVGVVGHLDLTGRHRLGIVEVGQDADSLHGCALGGGSGQRLVLLPLDLLLVRHTGDSQCCCDGVCLGLGFAVQVGPNSGRGKGLLGGCRGGAGGIRCRRLAAATNGRVEPLEGLNLSVGMGSVDGLGLVGYILPQLGAAQGHAHPDLGRCCGSLLVTLGGSAVPLLVGRGVLCGVVCRVLRGVADHLDSLRGDHRVAPAKPGASRGELPWAPVLGAVPAIVADDAVLGQAARGHRPRVDAGVCSTMKSANNGLGVVWLEWDLEPWLVRVLREVAELGQPILCVLVGTRVDGPHIAHCVGLDRDSEGWPVVLCLVLESLLGLRKDGIGVVALCLCRNEGGLVKRGQGSLGSANSAEGSVELLGLHCPLLSRHGLAGRQGGHGALRDREELLRLVHLLAQLLKQRLCPLKLLLQVLQAAGPQPAVHAAAVHGIQMQVAQEHPGVLNKGLHDIAAAAKLPAVVEAIVGLAAHLSEEALEPGKGPQENRYSLLGCVVCILGCLRVKYKPVAALPARLRASGSHGWG
mmetsp:Transcript_40481/g.114653  ORF Transcript_40481/g.114653 Transcript_40481/m.114653 type:complete len:754 (+) Transcript_40481:791-3052(+)